MQKICMKKPVIVNEFLSGLNIVWNCLFIKDPCKKCIIRVCCSKECDQRITFLYYLSPFNNAITARMSAWAVVFSMVTTIISIVAVILKYYQ